MEFLANDLIGQLYPSPNLVSGLILSLMAIFYCMAVVVHVVFFVQLYVNYTNKRFYLIRKKIWILMKFDIPIIVVLLIPMQIDMNYLVEYTDNSKLSIDIYTGMAKKTQIFSDILAPILMFYDILKSSILVLIAVGLIFSMKKGFEKIAKHFTKYVMTLPVFYIFAIIFFWPISTYPEQIEQQSNVVELYTAGSLVLPIILASIVAYRTIEFHEYIAQLSSFFDND